MDNINPYEPPREVIEVVPKPPSRVDPLLFISWPVVFGLNLIIPILFGWDFTSEHGRLGAGFAMMLFLVSGWLTCYYYTEMVRKIILGATFTALSQFFPILQIFAGFVAMGIAERFGLNGAGNDEYFQFPLITSELGGFVVTAIVGGILLSVAGMIGWGLTWITAKPSIEEVLYGDDAEEIA